MKVENIVNGNVLDFDDNTDADYALLYANCVEDDNLASWFFSKVMENKLKDVKKKFRIYHGKLTVSCGDWFYRKGIQNA